MIELASLRFIIVIILLERSVTAVVSPHCVKSVSVFGVILVRMRKNRDQKNSEMDTFYTVPLADFIPQVFLIAPENIRNVFRECRKRPVGFILRINPFVPSAPLLKVTIKLQNNNLITLFSSAESPLQFKLYSINSRS